jgi:hypothetical protein
MRNQSTDQSVYLASALSFATGLGLRVFPCWPSDKTPAIAGGCLRATLNPHQIRDWWERNPNYNVAIATGKTAHKSHLLVVDIDPKGLAFYNEYPELFRHTLTVRTGRDGLHLYYYVDNLEGIKNSRSKLADDIDIRVEGGYVIAPPSKHESGSFYRWASTIKEPQPIGEQLLELLYDIHKPKPIKQETIDVPFYRDSQMGNRLVRYYLRKASGKRNVEGFNLCCQLRDAGYSEDEARYYMMQYQASVPAGEHEYTVREAMKSLQQAYKVQPRRPLVGYERGAGGKNGGY